MANWHGTFSWEQKIIFLLEKDIVELIGLVINLAIRSREIAIAFSSIFCCCWLNHFDSFMSINVAQSLYFYWRIRKLCFDLTQFLSIFSDEKKYFYILQWNEKLLFCSKSILRPHLVNQLHFVTEIRGSSHVMGI